MDETLRTAPPVYKSHVDRVTRVAETLAAAIHHDLFDVGCPLDLPSQRLLSVDTALHRRLTDLNDGQSALASLIGLLSDQHSILAARDKALRTLLVPIHMLPVETMNRIFAFTYYSRDLPERAACAISLASVCRSWRELALHRAFLWKTYDAAWAPEYGTLMSRRAGYGQIDVIMSDANTTVQMGLPPVEYWNSLSLRCNPFVPSWNVFLQIAPSLQSLKKLTLDMDAGEPEATSEVHLGKFLPNLTTLHVINIPASIIWSPLSAKLTKLRFDIIISDRGLRRILFECTNLESLSLESVVANGGGVVGFASSLEAAGWANEPLVVPPTLRTLTFCQIHAGYVCHLIKWLRAPALKALKIRTMYGTVVDSKHLETTWAEMCQKFCLQFHALERLTLECDAYLMHAILPVMRAGFSTSSKPSANRIPLCGAPRGSLLSLHNNSFLPNIRELSLTAAVFCLYHVTPRPPPLSALVLNEDLQALLDAMRRSEEGRPTSSRADNEGKSLYKLHLSGFGFTAAEVAELQKYAWVLRVGV